MPKTWTSPAHSLLHLIDTTISSQGRQRLTSWLLEQPSPTVAWRTRQALIRELTPSRCFGTA